VRTRHDGPTADRHQAGPVLGPGRAVRPEPATATARRAGRVPQGSAATTNATATAAAVRGWTRGGQTAKFVGRHGLCADDRKL